MTKLQAKRVSTAPEDTRDKLLKAAIQVFSDRGYEGATMRAICHRAGVNLALVTQAAVRDEKPFPSPIHPVGSIASVTSTIVNDGGTLLCTRKLDEVVGLEFDPLARQVVRVQAGCRLKKLNMWLQAHRMEIPFQRSSGLVRGGSAIIVWIGFMCLGGWSDSEETFCIYPPPTISVGVSPFTRGI